MKPLLNNRLTILMPQALIVFWAGSNFVFANRFEYYDLATTGLFYGGVFLVSALLTALAVTILPNRRNHIAIASCVFLVVMFLTPALRDHLDPYLRYRYTLGISFLAFLVLSFFAIRVLSDKNHIRLISAFFLMLSLMPTGQLVLFKLTESDGDQSIKMPLKAEPVRKPNVYYILLDSYMRADTLKTNLGYDNSAFIDFLGEADFYVADQSYVGYPTTIYSLTTTFRMQHVTEFEPHIWSRRFKGDTHKIFHSLGYRSYFMPQSRGIVPCPENITCFNNTPHSDRFMIGRLGTTLIKSIPLLEDFLLAAIPNRFEYELNEVPDLLGYLREFSPEEPSFLYAHILMPHPPYLRDADCRKLDFKSGGDFGSFRWEVRNRFIEFLECGNRQVTEIVDTIVKKDPEAIVILQGDHGTYFTNHRHTGQKGEPVPGSEPWKKAAFEEAYASLNAFRAPATCRDNLYPAISPVNTFRFVFSCLTDTRPDYLPDTAFWIDRKNKRLKKIREQGAWLF